MMYTGTDFDVIRSTNLTQLLTQFIDLVPIIIPLVIGVMVLIKGLQFVKQMIRGA